MQTPAVNQHRLCSSVVLLLGVHAHSHPPRDEVMMTKKKIGTVAKREDITKRDDDELWWRQIVI